MLQKTILVLLLVGAYFTQVCSGREFFYVYSGKMPQENRYFPSGMMGDTQDVVLSGAYVPTPSGGEACLRITYKPKGDKAWAGIYWQNPPNNWGSVPGGYNLEGAERLTFWAKGEKGREKIALFKIGGITGKYNDSDTAFIGPVVLSKDWKQYTIDLEGKDLSYICGGFCFVVRKEDNCRGCTFYLDEIRYEGTKIKTPEIPGDNIPPEVSLQIPISYFSPDGDGVDDLLPLEPKARDNVGVDKWRLEILNRGGKTVKVFQGSGEPPWRLTWDGVEDYSSNTSAPGEYVVVFSAQDRAGNLGVTEKQIIELKRASGLRDLRVREEEKRLVVTVTSRVLFDFDSAELRETAYAPLDELIRLLNAYPNNKLRVEGHTDSIGTTEYNLALSKLRAERVADYLVEKGIPRSRMEVVGYGETKPIASNDTVSGRQENRRVEIVILK